MPLPFRLDEDGTTDYGYIDRWREEDRFPRERNFRTLQTPEAVAAQVNGRLVDLSRPVEEDASVSFVSVHSKKGLEVLRHSAAHVMAQAVKELFPNVKLTFGPSTDTGFYYDFDYERTFTPQDLEKIEKRISEIVQEDLPFVRKEVSKEEAIKTFRERGETYKVEHLEDLPDHVSLYRQGDFPGSLRRASSPFDGEESRPSSFSMFPGPTGGGMPETRSCRGSTERPFRSPGTCRTTSICSRRPANGTTGNWARELDLFTIQDEAGPGLVIYHPKGAILRTILEDFEKKEHLKRGYQIVIGPQLLRLDLWKRSGHFENYRDKMYFTKVEDDEYGIKPMNCLAHMLIYNRRFGATGIFLCATSSWARSTATRNRENSTGCFGSEDLPRTMPISSAGRISCTTRLPPSSTLWTM